MTGQAREKINAEMQKRPDDRYREIVGQYVIDRLEGAGAAAEIAGGKKTLEAAMQQVQKTAAGKKQGSVAVLTPDEVFGVIDRYFGFSHDAAAQMAALGMEQPKPAGMAGGMALELEDFL